MLEETSSEELIVTRCCTEKSTAELNVEDLCAKWDAESDDLTLRQISFRLKPGQLMAVIGQVGAGKSTLLMTLLGELPNSTGCVRVKGAKFRFLIEFDCVTHISITYSIYCYSYY